MNERMPMPSPEEIGVTDTPKHGDEELTAEPPLSKEEGQEIREHLKTLDDRLKAAIQKLPDSFNFQHTPGNQSVLPTEMTHLSRRAFPVSVLIGTRASITGIGRSISLHKPSNEIVERVRLVERVVADVERIADRYTEKMDHRRQTPERQAQVDTLVKLVKTNLVPPAQEALRAIRSDSALGVTVGDWSSTRIARLIGEKEVAILRLLERSRDDDNLRTEIAEAIRSFHELTRQLKLLAEKQYREGGSYGHAIEADRQLEKEFNEVIFPKNGVGE